MSHEPARVLCIRDPDYENTYVFDGAVEQYTIDIGARWRNYGELNDALADPTHPLHAEAEECVAEWHEMVKNLPSDSNVRRAVIEYADELRK